MGDLVLYNPELDDEDMELIEIDKPKRRKRRSNPSYQASGFTQVLTLGGLGYLLWCLIVKGQTGIWDWRPWRLTTQPKLQLGRPKQQSEAERQRQRSYDEAVERMMAPRPSVVERDIWEKPDFKPTSEETVSFIEP